MLLIGRKLCYLYVVPITYFGLGEDIQSITQKDFGQPFLEPGIRSVVDES